MDKRQKNNRFRDIFSDERRIFLFFLLLWLGIGVYGCFQGFGEDTDSWLMAQTAHRLRLGEPYDPARSLGNPVYEFLLVILQPDAQWLLSNLVSLVLSVLFLIRLRAAFPGLSSWHLTILRLSLMATPVFREAATSSMEYLLAWYLLLETLILSQTRFAWFPVLALASFTRPEFFPVLVLALWGSGETGMEKVQGRTRIRVGFLLMAVSWLMYLGWAWGRNPLPFADVSEGFRFYLARAGFLFRQAGFLTPVYLLAASGLFLYGSIPVSFRRAGWGSLVFFLLFPFEWAYLFPAMFIGAAGWMPELPMRIKAILPFGILFLSVVAIHKNWVPALRLTPFENRQCMTRLYESGQQYNPSVPTLLLTGATYLPTRADRWERSHGNRIFRRKGSRLFVGEKLVPAELDSFQKAGFRIYGLETERGGLEPKAPGVTWLTREKLLKMFRADR